MVIARTEHYNKLTEFLRNERVRSKVTFFPDGFTYLSSTLAISFIRESKSNYRVVIICPNETVQQTYTSVASAIEDIREFVTFENPEEQCA